jgi:hypothetical protein
VSEGEPSPPKGLLVPLPRGPNEGADNSGKLRDGSARRQEGLTDGKDVSLSTNQLPVVGLSRDNQVLPYV